MYNQIVVYKGRTTIVQVATGTDVSEDVFTSEIRTGKDSDSELLATWVVTFATDGTDGELILTLDDSASAEIERVNAFMDIKRMSGGEPISVFNDPLPVVFREVVTA